MTMGALMVSPSRSSTPVTLSPSTMIRLTTARNRSSPPWDSNMVCTRAARVPMPPSSFFIISIPGGAARAKAKQVALPGV